MSKNTICLWYDKDAEEAAKFYAATFPDSSVGAVHLSPADNPGNKAGDVITVDFMVCGIPCMGLNGGPNVKHNWAFSFQIATDDQDETDRYWNAIVGNGGAESQCGWCNDKWGVNWQIHPARPDRSNGARRRCRQACLRSDDDNGQDRRGEDRSGGKRMSALAGG